jgi:farnesyl-diphosphate farnesyltransferase
MDSVSSDVVYQDQILPHVSRTFALTIPQLPEGLRTAVTTAYLLCRIADTIEDEPALSPPETLAFLQRFNAAVGGVGDPALLGRQVADRLSSGTLPTERDLVAHTDRVLEVFRSFNDRQQAAIRRCVELMCYGMPRFQFSASLAGLARSTDLDDYCYYVAGVVGDMLTELFCDHSPLIARRRGRLSALSASFAQGLQMTNILKDVWEDRARGACWLPQDVFARHGVELAAVSSQPFDPRFGAGFRELVGVAHAHLRNALEYTLLIPRRETGIRRFCLWAIGLAVLTLRKIAENPAFTKGAEVKVKRSAVATTRLLTQAAGRSDLMLRALFSYAARGLPLADLPELRRPRPVLTRLAEDASASAPEPALRRSYGNSGS